MDICFYEVFREEEESLRKYLGTDLECSFTPGTIQESGDNAPPARLISIRTQSVVPDSWANSLSGVLTRSMGYDHLERFRQSSGTSIPLGYLEEYSAQAVAEHAMMLAASLLRKLPKQMEQFRSFHRDGLTGLECGGKNLLVVGVGRIGKIVAALGAGMGMEVHGVDIVHRFPNIPYVQFPDGIRTADVVVCCMNLTEENRGYFNAKSLSTAKRGCIFVNIARGEESPTADLAKLLDAGIVGGVGLDVYDEEPVLADALRSGKSPGVPVLTALQRLLRHPNVICTPHNAFNSAEAVERKSKMSADQLRYFLAEGRFLLQLT
jgi:D-lactate dehydrogenase